ncbi:MAG: DUF4431 domain-containing protein [Helicobacteraceae bacterium]|nr:DUF4431 domain-containing protein [Helicobacteraceae bacterium]
MNFELLEKLVGKSVCVSANAVASHTAHHIPPVILVSPKLISKSQNN